MRQVPDRLALELGELEEVVSLRRTVASHSVAHERNHARDGKAHEKSDRCLLHAAAAVCSNRELGWLDDVDDRQILHLLDTRRLVGAQKRRLDLVAHRHLPLQPVELEG